jgi:hypothetical protein
MWVRDVWQTCSTLCGQPLLYSPLVPTATAPWTRYSYISLPSHLLLGSRIVILLRNVEMELHRPYLNCFLTRCFVLSLIEMTKHKDLYFSNQICFKLILWFTIHFNITLPSTLRSPQLLCSIEIFQNKTVHLKNISLRDMQHLSNKMLW